MRTGLPGAQSKAAHAVFAVTGATTMSSTRLIQQFDSAEFVIAEQPRISQTRRDGAVVFSAVRVDSASAGRTDLMVTLIGTYTQHLILVPYSEFQPVWSVETWSATGIELLVTDDTDACMQLDAVSDATGVARGLITINPRVGWQGYGHPDVQALG